MNILNYYNELTGIPMSYNFFVQNITVIIKKTKFLIPIIEKKTELILKKIEENKLDVRNRNSININFKVFADTQIINVDYTSFEEVLEHLVDFSTFSLFAIILSDIVYNNFFFKYNTLNSVFKFAKSNNNKESFKNNILRNDYENQYNSDLNENENRHENEKTNKKSNENNNINIITNNIKIENLNVSSFVNSDLTYNRSEDRLQEKIHYI